MKTPYEAGSAVYRPAHEAVRRSDERRQMLSRIVSETSSPPSCMASFPALTPHEIATLILIAHAPEQVGREWPDLQPLLSGNLVEIDKCQQCRGKPHVTPLGDSLITRIRKMALSIGRRVNL